MVSPGGANADVLFASKRKSCSLLGGKYKRGMVQTDNKRGQRGSEDGGSNDNQKKMTHTSEARGEEVGRLIFS